MSGESALAAEMAAKLLRTNIYIEPETLAEIDEIRRKEVSLPSRAEIIRRLIREALAARAKAKPSK